MGIYDTYGKLGGQLKVGHVCIREYCVGDMVPIPDGVYVTTVNVIVVKDGIFIAEYGFLIDKWGNQIQPGDAITNPLEAVIDRVLKECEELKFVDPSNSLALTDDGWREQEKEMLDKLKEVAEKNEVQPIGEDVSDRLIKLIEGWAKGWKEEDELEASLGYGKIGEHEKRII